MGPGAASQVSAIEPVYALERNGAAFLALKLFGDLPPGFALPPLLADEFNVRIEPAVKRRAAAGSYAFLLVRAGCGFRMHRQREYGGSCSMH
jgi:hypothetical protein